MSKKDLIFTTVFLFFIASTAVQLPVLAQSADVRFSAINPDGEVYRTESDEWIEIQNMSGWVVSLSGWSITANDGQRFHFPDSAIIQPNQTCRVYTNESHGGCSFNWGSGTARWNNSGDCGRLYDNGVLIDTFCYTGGFDEGTPQYPSNNQPSPAPSDPSPQPAPPSSGGEPCPPTGAWPAGCVPGGSPAPSPAPSPPSSDGQPCPESGAWPAGCVPQANPAPNPSPDPQPPINGAPCPDSGAWPAGCVPGGSPAPSPAPSPPSGGGQPCPESGAWPAGCVPSGSGPTPNPPNPPSGGGQPCPDSGAWPAGCVPGGSSPAPAGAYDHADAERMVAENWRIPLSGNPETKICYDAESAYSTVPLWAVCEYEYNFSEVETAAYVELSAAVAENEQGARTVYQDQVRQLREIGQVEEYGSWAMSCDTDTVDGVVFYFCLKVRYDNNMVRNVFTVAFSSLAETRQLTVDTDF